MSIALNDLVVAWLTNHGFSPIPPDSYLIENNGTTGVAAITSWNTGVLGAEPSDADLQNLIPQVTIQQWAQSDYAGKIAQGIAVTSTGTPALNATYALDPVTLSQIQALATDCAAGFGFPGGAGTFAYPDLTGTPHTFDSTSIVNLYKAMRGLIYSMQITLAARLQGTDTAWPSASVTIA